jgi:hypothetical protein
MKVGDREELRAHPQTLWWRLVDFHPHFFTKRGSNLTSSRFSLGLWLVNNIRMIRYIPENAARVGRLYPKSRGIIDIIGTKPQAKALEPLANFPGRQTTALVTGAVPIKPASQGGD